MTVICKNCQTPFEREPNTGRNGQPRLHCSPECCERYRRRCMRLRYRHDVGFREAQKAISLQRYYERKQSHAG